MPSGMLFCFFNPIPNLASRYPETLPQTINFYSYFLIFVHYSKYGRNTR